MSDRAYEPASVDPYDQIDPDKGGAIIGAQPHPQQQPADPYDAIDPDKGGKVLAPEDQSSATGAFARSAARSALPAIGSFPAIGAGAEAGAVAGAAVGGPFAEITAPVGGLIGGAIGAIGGSMALDKVQNYALSMLPDSWRDKIGMSDRQEQLDQGEHPTASFLGGLVPYAVTMRPGAAPTTALPENATALQRILAHPVTARLFGGAAMGGMEIGQEKVEDGQVSWPKAAIATGFGLVFNRPTRFGEAITELGARPARAVLGRPSPTLADANAAGVMGPGATEQTFQGSQERDPSSAMAAQETKRQEQAVVGEPEPSPDLHAVARGMHPELFAHYDDLVARQTALRDWLDEQGTENAPAAATHLAETEKELGTVAPEVQAAYRRAAEATQAPAVPASPEGQRFASLADMIAARGEAPAPTGAVPPRPIEEQRATIQNDVARQMIAAGRPEAEAQATGAIVAERYVTRAGRFNGALGTPEELYNREGARIQAGRQPPGSTPSGATTPAPTEPPTPATATAETAEQEPALTAPRSRRGPSSRDPNTYSLLEAIAADGGIRSDDRLIGDVRSSIGAKNKFIPGFGMLIRNPKELSTAAQRGGVKAPKFLDMVREARVHSGHLQDVGEISRGVAQSTIADLLNGIDKEARGERVYPLGFEKERELDPAEQEHLREQAKADRDEFDKSINDEVKASGGRALSKKDMDRAYEIKQQEGIHEAPEILERLYLEARDDAIDSGATDHEQPEAIAGWDDAQHAGAVERASELAQGVSTPEGAAGGEARGTGGEGGGATTEELAEHFQRRKPNRNLVAEREAEGQLGLPETERITQGEQAQRLANEPLKPSVEQKPMDEGLFGTAKDQFGERPRDLFDTEIPNEEAAKSETPQEEPAKPPLELTPTEPRGIQDFGEKIEGARKDTFTGFRDSLREEMDVATAPLSKSFPQPNYEKLAAEGVNSRSLAYIAIMRDMIPNKPRQSYKVKQWAAQVETLRSFSRMLLDGEVDAATLDARMKDKYSLRALPLTAEAISDIAPADIPRAAKYRINSGSYSMLNGQRYTPSKTFWFIESPESRTLRNPLSNDPANPYTYRESPAEAVALAKQIIPLELAKENAAPEGPRSKYTEVNLFRDRATGGVYLGLKVRSTVIRLKAGFEDVKAAREYLQENRDELQKTIDDMRRGPNERGTENRPRTGESLRVGDVSPQSFDDTFGFRGVQFGNYVEDTRRQADLNRAYDALMDLADVLGVPPKALSLNGQLGMAFGARGTGGPRAAAAHYEPIQVVINLTKGAGPGSLAHEWLHALDNYFARQDVGKEKSTNYISANQRDSGLVRDEVYQAWKNLEKTLATGGFAQRAAKFDEARSKPYWNTTIEKAARSFEKYVVDRLDEKGAVNDYLANIDTSGGAYPTSEEMQNSGIRAAYDRLFDTIEQRNTDRGVELYQGVTQGKIRMTLPIGREGEKPLMTIMRAGDASTAIHEFGHAWLGELMRDSLHDQAPDDLKADAKTVLDWLGVDNPQDIKPRNHEKFARGFEQYIREGVAPTPRLASVFGKFRDWMLRIYQSLRGLGPQISPEVSAVFDRMLAMEPQRTVIAPERAVKPTLADLHVADAAHTEPAEAEPAGERVLTEAERFTHDLPGALQDAHAQIIEAKAAEHSGATSDHDAGAEAPIRPTETGSVQPSGGGPEPVAPGGAGGAGTGAELRGGNNAVSEGASQSAGGESAQPRPDEGLGDKPLAPRPAAQFGARESPFVDKAGNIRLENLTNDAEVRQAIRDAAGENNDFIGERRGVVTDGQVLDLAYDLGMEGAEKLVRTWVKGQAYNAEQVMAIRLLAKESASAVSQAAMKAAIGTDEDLMAYAAAKDRHRMIVSTLAGATAEAGRAMRAFRNITGLERSGEVDRLATQTPSQQTLFQLRREAKLAATLDTPQKVNKFMADSEKYSYGRMILEYWINGLISGPATHATYMIGNAVLAAEKAGPETAAAAAIGALRHSMGRQGDTVRLGEVAEQFKTGARNLGPAVKAALDAFRTGTTTALPGEGLGQNILLFPGAELAQGAALDEAAKLSDALGTATGMLRGAWDGIVAGGELVKAGGVPDAPLVGLRYSHLGAIPDVEIRGVAALPLGSAVRLPSRFIAAIHSFFRSVNYSMEKNRLAYRTAMNEGLTGTSFDARVGDLRQNPSEAMMEQARGEATQLTLMGQGGEFTKALSRLTNTPIFGLPIFKFIDPFVHISSNIIEQAVIERTPIGILSPEIRADLMGKNGNIAQDTASARMLMGTVYAVAVGGLAAEGYVSGSEPADPKQAAVWRLAGNQAHSVRIGDMWYDVHRLGAMGMLMGIAADLHDVAYLAETGDMLNAASHLQHAFTQNILDESFMRGPSDLIKAIDDPGRYGEAYIRNFLSSFIPYSVGMAQMARASDPYSRQARSVMDALKAKVPGMSESLLPRRDIWGEAMPNKDALGAAGVTAIYETRMSRDPVNVALLDLGVFPANVERKIRNVQLTDDQYDDFTRIAGRMTKMRLDAIVNSPDYRTWPNHIRHDVISEVITQSREAARGIMMAKYPQIVRDATEAKLKKATGQ